MFLQALLLPNPIQRSFLQMQEDTVKGCKAKCVERANESKYQSLGPFFSQGENGPEKWRPQKRRPQSCPYWRFVVDTEIPYRLPFWRISAGFCKSVWLLGSILNFPYRLRIVDRRVDCRDPVCRHRFRFPEVWSCLFRALNSPFSGAEMWWNSLFLQYFQDFRGLPPDYSSNLCPVFPGFLRDGKKHINFFNISFLAPTQNPPNFGPPERVHVPHFLGKDAKKEPT